MGKSREDVVTFLGEPNKSKAAGENGEILIYYASSDTRCHVATTTVDRLVDYCKNTPPDPLRSAECVRQRITLIDKNLKLMGGEK